MKRQLLNDLLIRAQSEEMGLIVKTSNQQKLGEELAAVRKELGLTGLIIARPSSPDEIYIVKETVELDL